MVNFPVQWILDYRVAFYLRSELNIISRGRKKAPSANKSGGGGLMSRLKLSATFIDQFNKNLQARAITNKHHSQLYYIFLIYQSDVFKH